MGFSSFLATSKASSPQGYQSTGLWACCKRYGDFSLMSRLVNLCSFFPSITFDSLVLSSACTLKHKSAFIKGVELGKLYPLNHILFSARTTNLFNELKEEYIHCYISGMLIGHEFSITSESEILYLIGSKSLSMNYQIALSYLNIDYEFVDGDLCFLKGMTKIFNTGVFDE